jgi:hypothetical protein
LNIDIVSNNSFSIRVFMFQKMRVLSLVCITAVLVACGGGGGGGDETPNFAGAYSVTLQQSVNNCSVNLPYVSSVLNTVTQSDRNIALVSNTAILAGSVDADNGGFSASKSEVSDGVLVTTSITYRTISANVFQARLNIVAGPCTITYDGNAIR